jgi:hypothetical protein
MDAIPREAHCGTILRSMSHHERKIAGVNSDRAFAEPAPLNWADAIIMAAAPKNGGDQDRLLQTWIVSH